MKKILFMALSLVIAITSCKQETKTTEVANADEKTEVVKIIKLSSQKIAQSLEFQATIQAYEEIHLAPATPGRIEAVNAEVGTRVSAGTVLVQMDRTQLHQAEVQLKNLTADFKRFDTLKKAGSIAGQKYDQFMAQYEVAQSNLDFLRENTRLKAPFSGIVSGKYYEAGEMYSGAPNTAAGKAAILSIVQIDRLKSVVSVSEKYFPLIKTGMPASVMSDIYPGKVFTGKVSLIYPVINPGSRTFDVEITIENREGLLRPGMFSRVILTPGEAEVTLLPSLAVLKMQGSNERYLFVEENGIAKRVSVSLGQRHNDDVEVLSSQLKPGDNIVISGQARLLDGMKVKVVN